MTGATDVRQLTATDHAKRPWTVGAHLDGALALLCLRGDFCPFCLAQLATWSFELERFSAAGARVMAASGDAPGQGAALVEGLALGFGVLSDPGGEGLLGPLGVWDDDEGVSLPAIVLIGPDGVVARRWVGRDYADRPRLAAVVDAVRALGAGPVTAVPPLPGAPEPGPRAMPVEHLGTYLRGVKYGVLALAGRTDTVADESARLVAHTNHALRALAARRPVPGDKGAR